VTVTALDVSRTSMTPPFHPFDEIIPIICGSFLAFVFISFISFVLMT